MKVVVAKNSGTGVYHTDAECTYAPGDSRTVLDRELAEAWDLRECKRCSGETEIHRQEEVAFPQKLRRGLIEVDSDE